MSQVHTTVTGSGQVTIAFAHVTHVEHQEPRAIVHLASGETVTLTDQAATGFLEAFRAWGKRPQFDPLAEAMANAGF